MLEYMKAKFDLSEIMSFNMDLVTMRLTVHGKDSLGRLSIKQDTMTKLDAARLFRLYVSSLAGLN